MRDAALLSWMARPRVAEQCDHLRSRWLYRACDAVLTAEMGVSFFPRALPPLIEAGSPAYRRVQGVANLAAQCVPAAYAWTRRRLMNSSQLPLISREVRLVGYGYGVTVFLVISPASDGTDVARALKVYRRSLGRRLDALLEEVRIRRGTFERVKVWYEGCSVLLPTQFAICHGPLLGRQAVVCLQPFVADRQRDMFEEISERDLLAVLAGQPALRDQFCEFAARTLRIAETEGACVDIVGRRNLALVGDGDAVRLLLMDHGVFDYTRRRIAEASLADLRVRLDYLQRIRGRLT